MMKCLLSMVLIIPLVVFLGGCQSGTDEPPGPGQAGPSEGAVPGPVASEHDEPAKPDTGRGLVGWWKFDEDSGTTAADSSGHGRAGTLKGELSFDEDSVEGRVGKALKLDRREGYVVIGGYKGVTGTQARTVSAWMKTRSNDGHVLSWGKDEGGGMFIFGFVQGRGRIGVTPKGGYLYMNETTHDDAWHHVAAVVGEAELPNLHDDVKVFKDGERAEIHDIGILDLWPIDTASDMDVRIGDGYEGVIDDVRIYDRPLSEEEIGLLFKAKQ